MTTSDTRARLEAAQVRLRLVRTALEHGEPLPVDVEERHVVHDLELLEEDLRTATAVHRKARASCEALEAEVADAARWWEARGSRPTALLTLGLASLLTVPFALWAVRAFPATWSEEVRALVAVAPAMILAWLLRARVFVGRFWRPVLPKWLRR